MTRWDYIPIYNSRNYNGVLNWNGKNCEGVIYNSRNYNGVLNSNRSCNSCLSTIVEIITEY